MCGSQRGIKNNKINSNVAESLSHVFVGHWRALCRSLWPFDAIVGKCKIKWFQQGAHIRLATQCDGLTDAFSTRDVYYFQFKYNFANGKKSTAHTHTHKNTFASGDRRFFRSLITMAPPRSLRLICFSLLVVPSTHSSFTLHTILRNYFRLNAGRFYMRVVRSHRTTFKLQKTHCKIEANENEKEKKCDDSRTIHAHRHSKRRQKKSASL